MQDGVKTAQDGAKTAQDGARTAQDGAKTAQDGPKTPFPRRPKDDEQVDYGDGKTVGRSQLLFFIRFIRFFALQEVPHCASAVGRAERCRRSRLDHVSILCTSTQSDSPSGANTKQGMTHHRPTTAHANARQTLCLIWLARVPARFHLQRASRSYVNTRFF